MKLQSPTFANAVASLITTKKCPLRNDNQTADSGIDRFGKINFINSIKKVLIDFSIRTFFLLI